jgi:hypothetical protein
MLPHFSVYAQIREWGPSTGTGGCMVDGVPTLKCLEVVFGNILFLSSAFIILVLFIMLVFGSFQYLTSFGSAEKVKKAQGTIRMAVVGFVLFISTYLILRIIDVLFLGGVGKIFQFSIGG